MADMPTVAHHVVHHAATVKPLITLGYSMITLLVTNALTAVVVGGLAWYIRGRGWQGVQNDINNIKADIEKLKGNAQAA